MIVGAYTFKSEDGLDVCKYFIRASVDVTYTVASDLSTIIRVDDYKYKLGTSVDSNGAASSNTCTNSGLTIKASF